MAIDTYKIGYNLIKKEMGEDNDLANKFHYAIIDARK